MWQFYIKDLADFEFAADRDYYFGPAYGCYGYKSNKRKTGWLVAPGMPAQRAKLDFQRMGFDSHASGYTAVFLVANQSFESAGIKLLEAENSILTQYKDFFFSEEKPDTLYILNSRLELNVKRFGDFDFFQNERNPFTLQESEANAEVIGEASILSALADETPVIVNIDNSQAQILTTEKIKPSATISVLGQKIGSYELI